MEPLERELLQIVLLIPNNPIKHTRLCTNCLHIWTCKITHLNTFSFVQSAVVTAVFVTCFLKHKILHSSNSVYLYASHPRHNSNYYPKQHYKICLHNGNSVSSVYWRKRNFILLGLFPTKEKLYNGNKLAVYMSPQSKILPAEWMLQQLRTPRAQQSVTACNILREDIGHANSWFWIDTSAQYRKHRVRRNPNIRHEERIKQTHKKMLPHPLFPPAPAMNISIVLFLFWRKFTVLCQFCWLQMAQQFCYRCVFFFMEWVYVLGSLFFKDEARFYLNGYISNQNLRMQSAETLHALQENSLYLTKVGVRFTVL